MTTSDHPPEERLLDLVLGPGDEPGDPARVRAHVDACAACAAALAALEREQAVLAAGLAPAPVPGADALAERVAARLRARPGWTASSWLRARLGTRRLAAAAALLAAAGAGLYLASGQGAKAQLVEAVRASDALALAAFTQGGVR